MPYQSKPSREPPERDKSDWKHVGKPKSSFGKKQADANATPTKTRTIPKRTLPTSLSPGNSS